MPLLGAHASGGGGRQFCECLDVELFHFCIGGDILSSLILVPHEGNSNLPVVEVHLASLVEVEWRTWVKSREWSKDGQILPSHSLFSLQKMLLLFRGIMRCRFDAPSQLYLLHHGVNDTKDGSGALCTGAGLQEVLSRVL